jgi:hypothetical protein
LSLIVYLAVGRLLIWIFQNASLSKKIYKKSSFLTELFECDFCLGVWTYALAGFLIDYNLFERPDLDVLPYILGVVVTAIITAFVVHLAVIGFRIQYGTTYIE